jgi:predicted HTH transcriptional regulator
MKAKGNLAVPKQLAAFMKRGESSTLEFKRSTAELQGAMRSLCAFVNGAGGMVIIGVGPYGRLLGQDVSDATQQKIAAALDRFSVPLDALREILLNAVMHRDYSDYSGYVAILVFDDRIEIQSHGLLPWGVTVEQLSGPHRLKLRNPLIAEAFHRTGAVEVWAGEPIES